MKKQISIFLFLLLGISFSYAQVKEHAKWKVSISPNAQVGKEATLTFEATIEDGWHLYANDFNSDLGPQITELELADGSKHKLVGKLISINPTHKHDEIWDGDVSFFEGKGVFTQKIIPTSSIIEGKIKGQVCQDMGQCAQTFNKFKIEIANTQIQTENKKTSIEPIVAASEKMIEALDTARADITAKQQSSIQTDITEGNLNTQKNTEPMTEEVSLITFMIIAFGAGLLALLTPCVFPMIPMTVTFFTKSQKSRAKGIELALLYGFFIVFIYTFFGFIITKTFGITALSGLSTNWIPNLLFFIIFIVFALSFLGVFEITLPNSWINKADQQSDKGGVIGVFFMALTLALISFSCTGPIVGTLLVQAFNGDIIRPVAGMFAFSLAFSIPFTLFAIFPSWLQSLPRSGGWLNTIKVSMGFVELALAQKFLSQADLNLNLYFLSRDIFLIIHIVVLFALGLYLLGMLKLEKGESTEGISIPRLLTGLAVWGLTLYLFTGLLGAPLKPLSGYLPPAHTSEWLNNSNEINKPKESIEGNMCEAPKYASDNLKMAKGLEGYFEYKQALACAKKLNKPLFVDFTGKGCANCRRMEENVFTEPRVLKILDKDFVIVSLYTDENNVEFPKEEWYTSTVDDEVKKTMGDQYLDMQIQKYGVNASPFYVIIDPNTEKQLTKKPRAFDLDVNHFLDFLNEAKNSFK